MVVPFFDLGRNVVNAWRPAERDSGRSAVAFPAPQHESGIQGCPAGDRRRGPRPFQISRHSQRSGRWTFENTPMATVYGQRTAKDERDWTIFDIPRDKRFVEMVQEYANGQGPDR